MANTTNDLVAALRCSSSAPLGQLGCRRCAFHAEETIEDKDYVGCDCDRIALDAADKIEELVDRCARYAEEIAVLREEKRMNAADAASVRYGQWEPCFDESEHWRQGIGKCSECGQEFYAHAINRYNFCPMCGSKMV